MQPPTKMNQFVSWPLIIGCFGTGRAMAGENQAGHSEKSRISSSLPASLRLYDFGRWEATF
jgi:hypothetical protein